MTDRLPIPYWFVAAFWLSTLTVLAVIGVGPAVAEGGSPAVSRETTNRRVTSSTTSLISVLEAAGEIDLRMPAPQMTGFPKHCPDCGGNPAVATGGSFAVGFDDINRRADSSTFVASDEVLSPIHRTSARLSADRFTQPQEWIDHIAAEPDDVTTQLSFRADVGRSWGRLKEDTAAVLQPGNLLLLGIAAGGAIAIHQDIDGEVREDTALHPNRWGNGTNALGYFGEITVQAPVMAGLYFWSLRTQNEELHDFSTTLLSAAALNGVSTTLLKYAVNTDRPSTRVENGQYGFPSFHASSSFTIASVLNEYYGWEVGVPAFAVATAVGWSRIDGRAHDVSDVFFGAALGYVIGTSVARHHLSGDSRVMLLPWTEPTNAAVGVQWQWSY